MSKLLYLALMLCIALSVMAREDESKVKATLEARYNEWLVAENKKDAELLTGFYDDNAVLMPSKEDLVIGKAAIHEWYKNLVVNPNFAPFTLTVDWNSFYLVGDIATATAAFDGDLTRNEKKSHFRGKLLIVWKMQADHSWKIFRYMYDEIPAKK